MMQPLVLQLQAECLDANVSILEVLRKTLVVARKLSLTEAQRLRPRAKAMAGRVGPLESPGGLVGAGRFERPPPCAQGGFRPVDEVPYFQALTFQ
jgi:hypothetical protein